MSETATPQPAGALKRTPLHELHVALGARMVPFAGYDMPVQYGLGVLKEHLHTRAAAGLFDVSHMGQLVVRPASGQLGDAALALERLIPIDIAGLPPGRQRYGFLTNDGGGILDDLMIANRGDHFLVVVNAACKEADRAYLVSRLAADATVEVRERALLALQGPAAESALAKLAPECAGLNFLDVHDLKIMGATCTVVRSGYTGEDGFEISTPADIARELAEALLENPAVQPIGLGARDSLRLEAGLCLYGADIDTATTPVAADLTWAISKARRPGGPRAGGFPGADVVLGELARGSPRRRVGLKPRGRAPVRAGAVLYRSEGSAEPVGTVTSGGFGPSLNAPVAMGYVESALAAIGTQLFADVRGQRLPVDVAALPFVPTRYKRGRAA